MKKYFWTYLLLVISHLDVLFCEMPFASLVIRFFIFFAVEFGEFFIYSRYQVLFLDT